MFTPSTIAVSAAVLEIADSAGASADNEMTARAGRSLFAGIKYINGRQNWAWLLKEAPPITVVPPFSVAITASAGIASASALVGHGVKTDDIITGEGFALGTRVSATAASGFGLNAAATATVSATVSATRDFYDLPSDWKQPYTVRMLSNRAVLTYAQRRAWDRVNVDEFAASTPQWYDLFGTFDRSKIRLLPPPAGADTLFLRYYRRMTVPTTSATADVLDIPQDYDMTLIAWSKWHFLTDKGDSERATTWLTFAKEGMAVMLSDQTRVPDESLAFTPGHYARRWPLDSPHSVNWDYTEY